MTNLPSSFEIFLLSFRTCERFGSTLSIQTETSNFLSRNLWGGGGSVADPDPGSDTFLTPGSGVRSKFFFRIPDLGSHTHFFASLVTIFWVKSTTVLSEQDQIFLTIKVVLNFGVFEATKKVGQQIFYSLIPVPQHWWTDVFPRAWFFTMCYNWIVHCDLAQCSTHRWHRAQSAAVRQSLLSGLSR